MAKQYADEKWKPMKFDFEYTNDVRIEISNYGRVRSFNYLYDGYLLKGSLTKGFRVIGMRFYKSREEKVQKRLDALVKQKFKMIRELSALKKTKASKRSIAEAAKLVEEFKAKLTKKFRDDTKSRGINYHSLIHRIVADYFIKKPTNKNVVIVAHLDYNKLNNHASNLKWMTLEENYKHRFNDPSIIQAKINRKLSITRNPSVAKLDVPKVMLLKKLLNEKKPIKELVKKFKVSEMQIYRIKRGENWGDIQAAK